MRGSVAVRTSPLHKHIADLTRNSFNGGLVLLESEQNTITGSASLLKVRRIPHLGCAGSRALRNTETPLARPAIKRYLWTTAVSLVLYSNFD